MASWLQQAGRKKGRKINYLLGSNKSKSKSFAGCKLGLGPRMQSMCKSICILTFIGGGLYCLNRLLSPFWLNPQDCPYSPAENTLGWNSSSYHSKWEKQMQWLLAMWEASPQLHLRRGDDPLVEQARRKLSNMSDVVGPHLEDCKTKSEEYKRLDLGFDVNSNEPLWGDLHMLDHTYSIDRAPLTDILGNMSYIREPIVPWVQGSDQDNLVMTRRVQHDLWLLQHPKNCSDEEVRFLIVSWTNNRKNGFGAQLHQMQGMLAIAIEDRRVLVTHDFDFARHQGCHGENYRRWSCYFLPETSLECSKRAHELMMDETAITDKKIVLMIEGERQWHFKTPSLWGAPWEKTHINVEVEGHLILQHDNMSQLWWRAQAARYFMRFPSEHTCMLMNKARHEAFGARAASNVLQFQSIMKPTKTNSLGGWLWSTEGDQEHDMEKWVWKSKKPWIPRPLISVHVRIGDKRREMKLVGFAQYMALAMRVRNKFPHVQDIWLSSEMQQAIDTSKYYPGWNFYYTKVARQTDSTSMGTYLESLGLETATSMSVVNLLMAADADYFIGAFGSTWCYLINHMKSTSGKLNSGYLSVNERKNKYW